MHAGMLTMLVLCAQAGFAEPALDGVASWFYATAELGALSVDTGASGHAVSAPASQGGVTKCLEPYLPWPIYSGICRRQSTANSPPFSPFVGTF
jgi:hypothetical protein